MRIALKKQKIFGVERLLNEHEKVPPVIKYALIMNGDYLEKMKLINL